MRDFAAIVATIDPRLCGHDRAVIAAVETHRPATLDALCALLGPTPRPYVFAAVARLEDLGYLPTGTIR